MSRFSVFFLLCSSGRKFRYKPDLQGTDHRQCDSGSIPIKFSLLMVDIKLQKCQISFKQSDENSVIDRISSIMFVFRLQPSPHIFHIRQFTESINSANNEKNTCLNSYFILSIIFALIFLLFQGESTDKLIGVGVNPMEKTKQQVRFAADRARTATASAGKFQETIKGEKPNIKTGKKRKVGKYQLDTH